MTVKALIEKLQGYDPFLQVCTTVCYHCDDTEVCMLEDQQLDLTCGPYKTEDDKMTYGPHLIIG